VRIRKKRGYSRRIEMLDSRESSPPVAVPDPVSVTGSRDVTELLLGVLRSIEPYEACIFEAERDGDSEVAAFLRELRRQDLIRAREATRLLKRSLEAAYVNVGKVGEPYVELSAGP
jgi:hypothetical protein